MKKYVSRFPSCCLYPMSMLYACTGTAIYIVHHSHALTNDNCSFQIESLKTKSSLAEKTIAALQTQLAQKSETLAMKSEELRELKKGRRCVEDDLSCSIEGMKEKQATVASLNDRVSPISPCTDQSRLYFVDANDSTCVNLVHITRLNSVLNIYHNLQL